MHFWDTSEFCDNTAFMEYWSDGKMECWELKEDNGLIVYSEPLPSL
jgi:hypothetical protein